MANHSATALLLMASLLVAVALSGSEARLLVRPNAVAAALHGANADGGYHHADAAASAVLEVEPTCSNCEPLPKQEPPCGSTCEREPKSKPKPKWTCNKVHGVQAGETCYSVAQCAGLTLNDFLGFNPNVNCYNLFVGQWVCLEATQA